MANQNNRRVICTIDALVESPDVPVVDSVFFGRVPTDRGVLCVSELVSDEVAARLCSIAGFRMFAGEVSEDQVEDALDTSRSTCSQAASSLDKQTIDELQLCNQAQSQELKGLRQELAEARKGGGGDNPTLKAELEQARTTIADGEKLIEEIGTEADTLRKQVGDLTAEKTALLKQIDTLTAEKAQLAAEKEQLTKQLAKAEKKKGGESKEEPAPAAPGS